MNYSQPKIIVSPISGQPVKPVIKEYINREANVVVKEAHYFDPSSGIFIRKSVISETPIENKAS